jgi:uncharacterized protein YcbK (DUF882 family)
VGGGGGISGSIPQNYPTSYSPVATMSVVGGGGGISGSIPQNYPTSYSPVASTSVVGGGGGSMASSFPSVSGGGGAPAPVATASVVGGGPSGGTSVAVDAPVRPGPTPQSMTAALQAVAAASAGRSLPVVEIPVAGGGAIAVVGGNGGLNSGAAAGTTGTAAPIAGAQAGAGALGAAPAPGGAAAPATAKAGAKGASKKSSKQKDSDAASAKGSKAKGKSKGKKSGKTTVDKSEIKKYVSGDTKGLNPELMSKLAELAKGVGGKIDIRSGLRSRQEQEVLYAKYLNGTGNLAAKPGTSNHESGDAADAYINGTALRDDPKAKALAEKLGLTFPVSGESWHVELG